MESGWAVVVSCGISVESISSVESDSPSEDGESGNRVVDSEEGSETVAGKSVDSPSFSSGLGVLESVSASFSEDDVVDDVDSVKSVEDSVDIFGFVVESDSKTVVVSVTVTSVIEDVEEVSTVADSVVTFIVDAVVELDAGAIVEVVSSSSLVSSSEVETLSELGSVFSS